ncbi:MAG: hypothetical protein KJ057_12865 [Phycisphaerae bacterium]|nr:MAG: hypothetical protein EDS66_13000 [Planctomycetota bacterium]MBE7457396.1 hypothetical protein [Planctomycetia bacterium]MCL4719355.1 hypothetical protein [Phycisphaerae bacterium]
MAADTRGIRAGRAFVELGVSDKLTSALKAADKRLRAFGGGVRDIGVKLLAVGSAATGALLSTAKIFADVGDSLNDMSVRTGVSVESLSELSFAAEQSGADMETLEKGLRAMQRTIVEAGSGSKSAVDALGRLGLNVDGLLALSPEQQFKAIADQMAKIADPTIRAATALDIFSRSGTQLLPLMAEGAAGIEELQKQARQFGLTISTEDAQSAALLDDTLKLLWRTLKNVGFVIGSAIAPLLTDVAGKMAHLSAGVADWVRQSKPLIVSAFKVAVGVTAVGAAMIGLGTAIVGAGAVLGALTSAVTAVGATIGALVSPIGLAVASLAVLGAAVVKYTQVGAEALKWFGDQFGRLRDFVGDVLAGIRDAMLAGDVALAGRILWLTLKVAWQKGVTELNVIWTKAKTFFLEIGHKMWFGILKSAENAWSKLRSAWVETVSFMASVLADFGSSFSIIFEMLKGGAEEVGATLRGAVDESFDWQQAVLDIDRKISERIGAIDAEHGARLEAIAQRRAAALEEEERLHKGALDALRQREDEALARLREGRTVGVSKSEAELARLRAELADAIAAARAGVPVNAADPTVPRRLTDLLDDLPERLDLARQTARGVVTGTFNPFAVAGLGESAIERTARNTEDIARKINEMLRVLKEGGLKFAY